MFPEAGVGEAAGGVAAGVAYLLAFPGGFPLLSALLGFSQLSFKSAKNSAKHLTQISFNLLHIFFTIFLKLFLPIDNFFLLLSGCAINDIVDYVAKCVTHTHTHTLATQHNVHSKIQRYNEARAKYNSYYVFWPIIYVPKDTRHVLCGGICRHTRCAQRCEPIPRILLSIYYDYDIL